MELEKNAQVFIEEIAKKNLTEKINRNHISDMIDELKGDPLRFLFEILQNADDAYIDDKKLLDIEFYSENEYFGVSYEGKGFNEEDVRRICDFKSEVEGDKKKDKEKTGYKGIGFKTFFHYADSVAIVSSPYSFKFEVKENNLNSMITPIWIEKEKEKFPSYFAQKKVNFILKLLEDKQQEIKETITKISENQSSLIFLRHIGSISFTVKSKQIFQIKISSSNDDPFTLKTFRWNAKLLSQWFIYHSEPIIIDEKILNKIKKEKKPIYPERLNEKTYLQFAIEVKEKSLIPHKEGGFNATLPILSTQEHLPYYINGEFVLTTNRTQFYEDDWNKCLFEAAGFHQIKWFARLLEDDIENANKIINLLTKDLKIKAFSQNFLAGFEKGVKTIDWLPNLFNTLKSTAETLWVDETGFFQKFETFIKKSKIFHQKKDFILSPHIHENEKLISFKICKKFTYEDLLKEIEDYVQEMDDNVYKSFIDFIHKKRKRFKNLLQKKFLKTITGSFVKPADGKILMEEEIEFPRFEGIHFVSGSIFLKQKIKDWFLSDLKMEELDHLNFVKKIIVEKITKHELKEERVLKDVFKYLLKLYQKKILESWQKEKFFKRLCDFPLLTDKGKSKPASECYLFDSPKMPLEDLLFPEDIVSKKYLAITDQKKEVVNFLKCIGVKDEIVCQSVIYDDISCGRNSELKKYLEEMRKRYDLTQKMNPQHKLVIYDVPFIHYLLDKTKRQAYAPLFLKAIIDIWKSEENENFRSSYYVEGKNKKRAIDHWIKYFVQKYPCLEGKKGFYKAHELYLDKFSDLFEEDSFILKNPSIDFELAKFLGVKIHLNLQDILNIMADWKKNTQLARKENMKMIYEEIKHFSPKDKEALVAENEKIYLWGKNGCLHAACDLFLGEDFSSESNVKKLNNFTSDDWLEFLQLCGVKRRRNKCDYHPEQPARAIEIEKKLDKALINLAICHYDDHPGANYKMLLKTYHTLFRQLEIYTASKIKRALTEQLEESWIDICRVDSKIYFVKSKEIKNKLVEVLCDYFHFSSTNPAISEGLKAIVSDKKSEMKSVSSSKRKEIEDYLNKLDQEDSVDEQVINENPSASPLKRRNEEESKNDGKAEMSDGENEAKKSKPNDLTATPPSTSKKIEQKSSSTTKKKSTSRALFSPNQLEAKIKCTITRDSYINSLLLANQTKEEDKHLASDSSDSEEDEEGLDSFLEKESSEKKVGKKRKGMRKTIGFFDKTAISKLGERAVNEYLKREYVVPPDNATFKQSDNGFSVKQGDKEYRIEWPNQPYNADLKEESDSGEPYDFKVKENGQLIKVIEVKSTRSKKNSLFEISPKELDLAEKFKEKYHLYRVLGVKPKNEADLAIDCDLEIISNLDQMIKDGKVEKKVSSYVLSYCKNK